MSRQDRSLAPKDVARIKLHLENKPEVARICRLLGVSVARFLEGIERQWQSCELYDALDETQRAKSAAEVFSTAQQCFAETRARSIGNADVLTTMDEQRRAQACRATTGGDRSCLVL
jgi:hypothetical protein